MKRKTKSKFADPLETIALLEGALTRTHTEIRVYRSLTDKQAEMIRRLEDEVADFKHSRRLRFWRDHCVALTIKNESLFRENYELKFKRGTSRG